jgi:hypothetical protein
MKKDKNYAQHKVIKPPALWSNKFYQFSNNHLQPWMYNFDGIVKSPFKDWIPAFAGKISMVSI